jgi:hypothetical protein
LLVVVKCSVFCCDLLKKQNALGWGEREIFEELQDGFHDNQRSINKQQCSKENDAFGMSLMDFDGILLALSSPTEES